MKREKSFKLSSLLILTFILTALFSVSVFAAELETPAKVTGLKQTDASKNGFDIAWDASIVAGAKYEVYLSADGKNWGTEPYTTVYNPKATIYSLSAGHTYYVAVRAFTSKWSSANGDEYAYGELSDVIDVVTRTDYDFTITQTDAKANSVSLKWNAVSGAMGYRVCIAVSGTSSYKDLGFARSNTTVISGLSPSAKYTINIYPVRVSSKGYIAEYKYGYSSIYSVKTAPAKIKQLEITNYETIGNSARAEWTDVNADGYEVQLYTYNSKKPVKKETRTWSYVYFNSLKQTFYKFRVRPYVTIGTVKKYGSWSSYKEFAPPVKYTTKSGTLKTKKVIPLSWKKVKGAKNYTVYMSTKQNSGFKKIATVKKNSCKVSKYKKKALKYGKNYYFRVVANRKSGKKTIKSIASIAGYSIIKKYSFK